MKLPATVEEIAAGATSKGGYTKAQLAEWGVPWPPPKGWRKALIEQARRTPGAPAAQPETPTTPVPSATKIGSDAHHVVAHTDGACVNNPGPGGWAAILVCGSRRKEITGHDPATTNNRMEITAAIAALEALKTPCRVSLYTDSTYLIDGITKWIDGWKRRGWQRKKKRVVEPVPNADLWQRLDAARQLHEVEWLWVKGHAGTAENERADKLAEAAARSPKNVEQILP
jgi:ribonuclease HI